jgi:hypothetical protein
MNDHKLVAAILTAAFWTSRQKAPDRTEETQLLEKYRWFLGQLGPCGKQPLTVGSSESVFQLRGLVVPPLPPSSEALLNDSVRWVPGRYSGHL